jgi:hypothetical protein
MRRLYYPGNPLDLFPLAFLNEYDPRLELSREFSTIAMIVAVAMLAEQKTRTRQFAAFVFVFGLWDLFYYVWLKVLIDWPRTWLEWDVLFLIPAVWLGPWICPAMIALLFTIWGGYALLTDRLVRFRLTSAILFLTGSIFGLVAFFQPAISFTANDPDASLAEFMPGAFWWWLFIPAFIMMVAGLAMTVPKAAATR